MKIDHHEGNALPLEVLSRGTREAVFIALRLSLAAAYARRGVMLPLILDDVLVNFDGDRALHAAETLRTFAELGHQVMMFTCHEHIVEIFHSIGVEVRGLPAQGVPGRAMILAPDEVEYDEEYDDEPEFEEEVAEQPIEEVEQEEEEIPVVETVIAPEPEPEVVVIKDPPRPKPPTPKPVVVQTLPEPLPEPSPEPLPGPTSIGWAWYEREPADGKISTEERAAETISAAHRAINNEWFDEEPAPEDVPEEVWNRNSAWWDGSRITS